MIDRSYRVQCFYMENDREVNARVEVDELSTILITSTPNLPSCKYEILDGSITGTQITTASIGQKVYHKWSCSTESANTFCMTVHSCIVNDGLGQRVSIIDEEGCATDERLISQLEYSNDLVAGQMSHVFKYADKEELFYECHISISIKEVDSDCPRPVCTPSIPPTSPSPRSQSPSHSNPSLPIIGSIHTFPSASPYRRVRSLSQFDVDVTAELTAVNGKIEESTTDVSRASCFETIFIFVLIPVAVISILIVVTAVFLLCLKKS
ncbi:hypothetical protein PFISCL1PPCAC_6196, partial [Pristionchus fissidentatus]